VTLGSSTAGILWKGLLLFDFDRIAAGIADLLAWIYLFSFYITYLILIAL